MMIKDISRGTTRFIILNIQLDGVSEDLTADTINFLVKTNKTDANSDAVINVDADVITSGSTGTAIISLSVADTDIPFGNYFYETLWTKDTGEKFMLLDSNINILERVKLLT